jgi:hypothetical protein
MFSKAIRAGRLKVRYSVCDFIEARSSHEAGSGLSGKANSERTGEERANRDNSRRGRLRVFYPTRASQAPVAD